MLREFLKSCFVKLMVLNAKLKYPLKPVGKLVRGPLRRHYHKSKTLKHDSGFNFKADLLNVLHSFLVIEHPIDYKIYDENIQFRSSGSLMSMQGYYVGEVEYHVLRYLRKCLTNNFVMLDVGAHHGLYSVVAGFELNNMQLDGKIYSFEPDIRNYEYLKINVNNNEVVNLVECFNAGVADRNGELDFVVNINDNSDNMLKKINAISVPKDQEIRTIDVYSLDEFVEERNIAKVDLIKIDTQGAEGLVLEGACEVIARDNPTLIVEAVEGQDYSEDVVRKLNSFGYKIYGITELGQLCDFRSKEAFVSWDCIAIPFSKLPA